MAFATLGPPAVARSTSPHTALAFDVYTFLLQEQQFDLVYFLDWGGLGYFAVNAKRQGEAFADVRLAVLMTGPRAWHAAVGRGASLASERHLQASYMERFQVRRSGSDKRRTRSLLSTRTLSPSSSPPPGWVSMTLGFVKYWAGR